MNIEVNGSFALGLDRMTAAWLRIGQFLSDEEIASLKQKDTEESLFQSAMRLLDRRPRTRAELAGRLRDKGYTEEQIEVVVARLEQSDLVNDRRFAESWSQDRSQFHPRSRRMISMELRQKGVAPEVAAEVVHEIQDDHVLALEAGRKALRRWQGLPYPDFMKKCTDYLARRGFGYGVIRAVLPDLWKELQDLTNNT